MVICMRGLFGHNSSLNENRLTHFEIPRLQSCHGSERTTNKQRRNNRRQKLVKVNQEHLFQYVLFLSLTFISCASNILTYQYHDGTACQSEN